METSKRIVSKPGKTQLILWGRVYFMDSFCCHCWSAADRACFRDGTQDHPRGLLNPRQQEWDPEVISWNSAYITEKRKIPHIMCLLASLLAKAVHYWTFIVQRMKSWACSSWLVDEPEEPARSVKWVRWQGKTLHISFVSYSYATGSILCFFCRVADKNGPAGRTSDALDFPQSTFTSIRFFSPGLPRNSLCGMVLVLAGFILAWSHESKAHGTGSINLLVYGGPRPGVTLVPREDS